MQQGFYCIMLADLKDDAGRAAVGTMLPPDDARFVDESFSSILQSIQSN